MPRFAALVVDVAVGSTVLLVAASGWLPGGTTTVLVLSIPALMVLWEALWLRLTGGTVGHWLTSIRLVWPGSTPSYGRLCWRSIKRYALFWLIPGQPSGVSAGALLVDTVPPIRFDRISRAIDGDGVVATRGWSFATTSAVFALCLAIPSAGLAAALMSLEPPWRAPVLGASLIWMAGALLSVISVADAWQHRGQPAVAAAA